MTIIELLLILGTVGLVLWYLMRGRGGHKHDWVYMISTGKSNEHNWFYCSTCMAQSMTSINESGFTESKVYELKKLRRQK